MYVLYALAFLPSKSGSGLKVDSALPEWPEMLAPPSRSFARSAGLSLRGRFGIVRLVEELELQL